ncbi:putative uncharacterized protein DDB_G0282133 [Cotesia glomerata]|uniref:putative uncharacterized protein DDB_G0282133 n=1 Tax=Cotesia glomerata TaxID=32391 RepID=UPI001D02AE57|nr:putative uncharacterized protein DDB_G0282133 [Cotesia glomerata]
MSLEKVHRESFKNSKRKRPGKVIHIDLTDDEPKETTICCGEKKKYTSGSLRWVKKILEIDKVKKKNGRGKNNNNNNNNNSDVQIVDAHSTANYGDINDKMPNYKPVFVNEVSESNFTNLMCQDINNYSTLLQVTDNCSRNNNNNSHNNSNSHNNNNSKNNNNNNNKPENVLLLYNDKLNCDLTAKQSCSSSNKSSNDVQELIINNRYKKIKNDDDSDYDNDISNLEICPVTTTVSSEDLSGDGIFWDDVNLFKYNDYKLEFDMENNYSDLKPTCEMNLKGDEVMKDTENDIGIFDNILQDVPIDRPGNWSYLFDCHLANIESPDAILSSTELTRKGFSKHNYMVSLGLSKKDCEEKNNGGDEALECQFDEDDDKKEDHFDAFGRQSSSGVSSTTSIISEQCQPRVDGKANRRSKIRGIKEPALKKKKKSKIFQHRRLHFKEDIESLKKN